MSIAVLISTLYWPRLLDYSGILGCMLFIVILFYKKQWHWVSVLPITALYFSSFTYISLLGLSEHVMFDSNIEQEATSSGPKIALPLPFISEKLLKEESIITVKVKSLINEKNSGYFIAKIISINTHHCAVCPLIEMRWYRPTVTVQAGQVHQFRVKLKELIGKGNPSGFDRQKWRYSQHIALQASIKEHLSVLEHAISARASLYQYALEATEGMAQQGALLALIFADKSLLSNEHKSLIKQLGIAHLFAVSGLHIGLIFILMIWILNPLLTHLLPLRLLGWWSWRIVHLCALCVCFGYGYISGFSLPTQRALLMLTLTLLMLASRRRVSALDLLILCFWLIVLHDPLAILSSSLWLSFSAMSVIVVSIWSVHRPVLPARKLSVQSIRDKIINVVKWLCLLQLILTVSLLPLQLLYFASFSRFALLVNLIAIPLFSWVIIPLSLLGTVALYVGRPLGEGILGFCNTLLTYFISSFESLSLGYVTLSTTEVTLLLSLLLLMIHALFMYFLLRTYRIQKWIIGVMSACLVAFICVRGAEYYWRTVGNWQVEVFDVGQGLSVLISSDGHYLLYDTGPTYPPFYSAANAFILPYLQAKGINHLDYMVISHSDNDHAGGLRVIAEEVGIAQILAGEPALIDLNSQTVTGCHSGGHFALGHLTLSVLSPAKVGKNNNNNSCVLQVSDGFTQLLLTGDISSKVERKILQGELGHLLSADILIAPHHGSKTSSSAPFIEQVAPQWVVFAAGYQNRWHFPAVEVVQRYQDLGITPLTTGKNGFIRFSIKNKQIEVKTFREDLAAYWYHQPLLF